MAEEIRHDVVTQGPLDRLAATLDLGEPAGAAGEVPPLGHWLFTLPDAPQSRLGADGHPEKGAFMPAVGQPRRMWAGSRLTFSGAIRVGDTIERKSLVAKVEDKGAMTFVTVQHQVAANGSVVVIEEQDLVYLPARQAGEAAAPRAVAVPAPESVRTMVADETMLLRFSALTFNAHRIHYDLRYTRDVEHYPALVVHGPLLATLLMYHALADQSSARVAAFAFRARNPVYCGEQFDLARNGDDLWVRKDDGTIAMTARIAWA